MALGLKNPVEGIYFLGFILIGVNFFLTGIIVNFFQLILWILLKPINVWLYRKITWYLTYINWGLMYFLGEWWSSSTCLIYTDDKTWEKMGSEHAILLLNHSYEVDWLFSWLYCEQVRMLGGAKALVKKSFKLVPVIGWTAFFSENVFLERNWEVDKVIIERQIDILSQYPDPVMLHLFAEGTRYTKAKYEASVEFAKKSGLTPMKHLLVPRTKGFVLCLNKLRGKFPAIYCTAMVFDTKEGSKPDFKSLALGRPVVAKVIVERIPLESIPEDPEKASNWLHENYLHKDNMIDMYKETGLFPTKLSSDHFFEGPIRAHFRPRRLWTLLLTIVSSYFTLLPLGNMFYFLLASGVAYAMIGIVLLGSVIYGLLKMMDLSSASKGSEYGRSPRSKDA